MTTKPDALEMLEANAKEPETWSEHEIHQALLAEREEHAREVSDLELKLRCARSLPVPDIGIGHPELTRLREREAEVESYAEQLEKDLTEARLIGQDGWSRFNQAAEVSLQLRAQLAAAPDLGPIEAAFEFLDAQVAYAISVGTLGSIVAECSAKLREALSAARKGAPAGASEKRECIWVVDDPETGLEEYDTQEAAQAAAEECLDEYRSMAGDGWDEDVLNLRWGRLEIFQQATETSRRPVDEGDAVASHIDEYAEIELVPKVAARSSQASSGGES